MRNYFFEPRCPVKHYAFLSLPSLWFFSSLKVGETALHSVSGIPPGRNNEDDQVNIVAILLEYGANLTFTTYQVMSQP